MALTTAERNRRKRERKKREREERRKREIEESQLAAGEEKKEDDARAEGDAVGGSEEIEIEYVAEPLLPAALLLGEAAPDVAATDPAAVADSSSSGERGGDDDISVILQRFQDRAAIVVTAYEAAASAGRENDESYPSSSSADRQEGGGSDEEGEDLSGLSKRKLKEMRRPTVAELKQRVKRADLVEAHDVTAADPDFLIYLKGAPGTVPVPRHWGRKRKYLQGKRGIEKPPFQLPDFIVKTGICDVRDATAEDETKMSVKQKNRARVSGRGGGVDVDYRTLHDAFFKHQMKPKSLTKFGDLYYEGKEFETQRSSEIRPDILSDRLRDALGMTTEGSPPPWLVNMQRYGPPPSYPNLLIPGLNAPLPHGCSYGYHLNGWGKPPVDAFGRPLYGGDPFGKPTSPDGADGDAMDGDGALFGMGSTAGGTVTSDGKPIGRKAWGALPTAFGEEEAEEEEEESSEEESSSDEEMAESEEEEEGEVAKEGAEAAVPLPGTESVLPEGVESVVPTSGLDLRKQPGDETPLVAAGPPKQLYTVLQEKAADKEGQAGAVFASDVAYVLPGASAVPEGAESVLSKVPTGEAGKRKRGKPDEDEDADELGKKFKF